MTTPLSIPVSPNRPANPQSPPKVGLGVGGIQMENEEDTPTANLTSPHDLTRFVDTLLNQLEDRFDEMSGDLMSRLTSLSTRVDSLENSIADLLSDVPSPDNPTDGPRIPSRQGSLVSSSGV